MQKKTAFILRIACSEETKSFPINRIKKIFPFYKSGLHRLRTFHHETNGTNFGDKENHDFDELH